MGPHRTLHALTLSLASGKVHPCHPAPTSSPGSSDLTLLLGTTVLMVPLRSKGDLIFFVIHSLQDVSSNTQVLARVVELLVFHSALLSE